MSSNQVRIWWDSSVQGYRFQTPYNPKYVDTLKQLIPFSERAWDAGTKTWVISEKVWESVRKITEAAFATVAQVVTRAQVEAQANASRAGATASGLASTVGGAANEFLTLIPYEAAQKAYRHAALLMHPDRGGDPDKMSKMNAAWQQVEKSIYGK